MKDKYYSIEDLAKIAGVSLNRMYTYMGRNEFEKFRRVSKIKNRTMQSYKFSKQFVYRLCDFFNIIHKQDCIENIIDYCEHTESETKK